MPVQINYEPNDICVLRISGILKRSEFGAEEKALARRIDTGLKPCLLVILEENFEGWERGADWNDLDFYISHGRKISKVAIVAEPIHDRTWWGWLAVVDAALEIVVAAGIIRPEPAHTGSAP